MRVLILTFVLLAIGSGAAAAASFCVEGTAMPPQCLYEDIVSCSGASSPPNTFCGVNSTAALYFYGSSRYCAVESNHIAQCLYNNFAECYATASQGKSVCMDREERTDDISPFKYDQRVEQSE